MSDRFSLPPIPVRKGQQRPVGQVPGSVAAFLDQFQGKRGFSSYYAELATLSARADYLKQENGLLKQELFDLVVSGDQTGFHQIKKKILAFTAKLAIREKEVDSVTKALSFARKSSQPTLLGSLLPKENSLGFDCVAESILVSNPQKNFFSADAIEKQNRELIQMCKKINESIKQYRKRLDIYESCQSTNKVSLKIESLKRGENPLDLVDVSPAQVVEQREKIKQLKQELRQLVYRRVRKSQSISQKIQSDTATAHHQSTPTIEPMSPTSPRSSKKRMAPRNKILKPARVVPVEVIPPVEFELIRDQAETSISKEENINKEQQESNIGLIKSQYGQLGEKLQKIETKIDEIDNKICSSGSANIFNPIQTTNEPTLEEDTIEEIKSIKTKQIEREPMPEKNTDSDVSECFEDELLASPQEEKSNGYTEYWRNT